MRLQGVCPGVVKTEFQTRQNMDKQDDRIVKVTSRADSSLTKGHLSIKGSFGFEFVNNRLAR